MGAHYAVGTDEAVGWYREGGVEGQLYHKLEGSLQTVLVWAQIRSGS